ncbi:MAG: hypothetical protein KatS3mg039_0019 [Candidatus Kapaibacterium sp.]|nr:MAG: hypothetical protein KatS3mg039_0019 [Candidatus Kapabacteria bacterium]
MSHTRPAAVVVVFTNQSGITHIEAAPSYAECVALLAADDSFVCRYGFDRIIYCEQYDRYSLACARADQLRRFPQQELERLLDAHNPERTPLTAEHVLGLLPIRSSLPNLRRRRVRRTRPILPFTPPPLRERGDG